MYLLHSNMVIAKTGNENNILDIRHMTVQKSLAYVDGYHI